MSNLILMYLKVRTHSHLMAMQTKQLKELVKSLCSLASNTFSLSFKLLWAVCDCILQQCWSCYKTVLNTGAGHLYLSYQHGLPCAPVSVSLGGSALHCFRFSLTSLCELSLQWCYNWNDLKHKIITSWIHII